MPPEVLSRLRSQPRSAFARLTERFEYRIMSTERRSAFLGKLPLLWFRWLRLSRNATGADESGTFLDYLRYHWQLDDQSQVPVEFFSKVVRRALRVPAERLQRR